MKRIIALLLTAALTGGLFYMQMREKPDIEADGRRLEAFAEYMNEKAATIGMTDSDFTGTVGTLNMTTANDLLRLLVYADSLEEIRNVWGEKTFTVSPGGGKCAQPDSDIHSHQR